MRALSRTRSVLLTFALMAAAAVVTFTVPTAAHASCAPDPGYTFSSVRTSYIAKYRVYGQTGVTLNVSETSGTSTTGTISGTLGTSVSVFIASANASVSASIAYSKTASYTLGGTWTVPSTQSSGWLAYGAQSRAMNWQYGSYTASCTWVVSRTGTANLPTLSPYVFHS